MNNIQTRFVKKEMKYDGSQLRSHYIYDQYNLMGDAILSFVGPCDVALQSMVDLQDVKLDSPIYSKSMLHFIIEHFGVSLENMVLRQRLLMAIIQQELLKKLSQKKIIRLGDDLYENDAKLSVSIATLSPVSGLIHIGVNVISKGTPVKTKGLEDYEVNPEELARRVMEEYKEELKSIYLATCKVRAVP